MSEVLNLMAISYSQKKGSDSKEVEFCVNDGREYNTCVKIVWGVEEGRWREVVWAII